MKSHGVLWVTVAVLAVCFAGAFYGFVHERTRVQPLLESYECAAERVALLEYDITRWEERFAACRDLLAVAAQSSGSSWASIVTGERTEEPGQERASVLPSPATDSLRYEILDEETHDSQIKAQVVLQVLVQGDLRESSLRLLLEELYAEAMGKQGFQYHDGTTNVYIYLFSSKEYAASRYQWVAMLEKSFSDASPKITVDRDRLEDYISPSQSTLRYGLTEGQRRVIFKDIVRAEDRARAESMVTYPDLLPSAPGYSQDAFLAQLGQQMGEQERLTESYKSALAREHGLTREQLDDIESEGLREDWPMPPLPD